MRGNIYKLNVGVLRALGTHGGKRARRGALRCTAHSVRARRGKPAHPLEIEGAETSGPSHDKKERSTLCICPSPQSHGVCTNRTAESRPAHQPCMHACFGPLPYFRQREVVFLWTASDACLGLSSDKGLARFPVRFHLYNHHHHLPSAQQKQSPSSPINHHQHRQSNHRPSPSISIIVSTIITIILSSPAVSAMMAIPFQHHHRSGSPPTYPSLHPPSPTPPADDPISCQIRLDYEPGKSLPHSQFANQAVRECKRLYYQVWAEKQTGKRVLPFDTASGIAGNAQNNVRARWIEQGIWKREWGPAWPSGTTKQICLVSPPPPGPCPDGLWLQEKAQTLPTLLLPPSPPSTSRRSIFTPPQPNTSAHAVPQASQQPVAETPPPNPCQASASRPWRQFQYQVANEHDWLRYEIRHKGGCPESIDLPTMAHGSVKRFWIESGIWSSRRWGDMPGRTWEHEQDPPRRQPCGSGWGDEAPPREPGSAG